jgi:hypothetical protein
MCAMKMYAISTDREKNLRSKVIELMAELLLLLLRFRLLLLAYRLEFPLERLFHPVSPLAVAPRFEIP